MPELEPTKPVLREASLIPKTLSQESSALNVPTGWWNRIVTSLLRWAEALRIAMDSILANRLRSILTVLGIVIGVTVVVLVAA